MRTYEIKRKTAETDISLSLCLDGNGQGIIDTGCGFLDHMLTLFAKHAHYDLSVKCIGDTNVDYHHTVEDIGIVMEFVFATLDGSRGWSGLLEDQILYSKEDHDQYAYMLENINFNYGSMFLEKGFDTWKSSISSAVTGKKSVSEAFSSTRSAIQDAIDKNVTWTIDELLGE